MIKVSAASSLILYAPNVHVGGGLVLLKSLCSVIKSNIKHCFLDDRARQTLDGFNFGPVKYVKRSILSRFLAEWRLMREAEIGDTVLCFHGLPPLLPVRGRVVVFLQNRILVSAIPLTGYSSFTRARLIFESLVLRFCASNVDEFIVQTPSMAKDALDMLGSSITVSICPFSSSAQVDRSAEAEIKDFDFVYVANSEVHKNHKILFDAWRLLAESGHKPKLALTLPKDSELILDLDKCVGKFGLEIINVGVLPPDGVMKLYFHSKALIFPSISESFGLPLIEAANCGLPILAPEMDYVRDVSDPVETFDPNSAVSIYRAVRRFIGCPEAVSKIGTPEDFLSRVLR